MYFDKNSFENELTRLKDTNKKIVFTNGCFDIIHMGHVDYLNKAKQLGDVLILGLNSDDSVKRLKGDSRPIVTENERGYILENLKSIDYVILFDEDTPKDLIEFIKPKILVKGGDYTHETIVGSDFVVKNGGEVKTIPFIDGCSTTKIIEKILKSEQ